MKIKDIMNKAVTIDQDISLKKASQIMSEKNIGCLIAVKGEKILGIITEKDITGNTSNLDKKVSSIMARKVVTINQDEDLDEASLLMKKNKIKKLPVINEDNRLAGIITSTDIVANSEEISDEFLFD